MNEMIKKIAQRRSIWNQIRPSNITRQIGKLNPQYKEEYEKLVAADEAIRKIQGPDGSDLRTLLKELKINNKGHRWLAVLDRAARINKLVSDIVNNEYVLALNEGHDKSIRDFYFTEEDAKGKSVDLEHIKNLTNASVEDIEIIKQALFGDLPRRITDKFLSAFYDKKEREIRRLINNIVNRAETLVRRALDTYKELDTARAKGNIGDYLNTINLLRREQQKFEALYKDSYNSMKDFLPKEKSEEGPEEPSVAQQPEEQVEQQEVTQESGEETPVEQKFQDVQLGPDGLGVEQQLELQPPLPQPNKKQFPWKGTQQAYQGSEQNELELPPAEPFENTYSFAAKKAIANKEYGIASAILSKYSQELENAGCIDESVKILLMAQELFNEK